MKKKKKRRISRLRFAIISLIVIGILVLSAFFIINNLNLTGKSVKTQDKKSQTLQIIPLSQSEKSKVQQTILQNPLVQDLPKSGVISLRFYKFENNQRIWQDEFLITKTQLLSTSTNLKQTPDVYVIMDSKYIPEITKDNLCEIVKKANLNGEFDITTDKNIPLLMIKYVKLIKYESCLG